MPKSRIETWVVAMVLALGLIPAAIAALFGFMTMTARRLHPDSQQVRSVAGGTPLPAWDDAVERARHIVRTHLVDHNLPGLSVAVGVDGEIVWAEGFGWADVDSRVPVAPTHRFRIGTASTALTSAAVGVLVDQNRLRLDDEIQTYVPEFPKHQSPVTVRQIMAHVAGLRSDGGDEGPLFSKPCDRPVDALRFFADQPLLFEPGTEFRYSTFGWIAVSAAIEAAAGQRLPTFMREKIFDPLGMRDTAIESASTAMPNRPTFYFPRFAADPRYGADVMREINLSCHAGAMAFLSTPLDLVRFATGIEAGRLLQPSTARLLETSQRLASGRDTGYGLGWKVDTVTLAGQQVRVAGTDGDVLGGMTASLMTVPDLHIVVAMTSNMSYSDTASAALKIAETFAQKPTAPARN